MASVVAGMGLVGYNYYFGTEKSDDTMTKETQENQPVPTIEMKKETDEEAHYDARKQADEMADLKNEVAELKKLLQQSSNNSHASSTEEYIREYSSSPSVHQHLSLPVRMNNIVSTIKKVNSQFNMCTTALESSSYRSSW